MGTKIIDRDLGFQKIIRDIKKMNNRHTEVGLFGEGDSPENNLAERGAVHEYGSKDGKIPSRPFMRNAFDNNLKELKKVVEKLYGRMIQGGLAPGQMLQKMGELHAGQIKEEITSGNFKPLESSTIAQKGSTKPLIDEGEMRASVTHRESKK